MKYARDLSKHIPEDEPFFVIRAKDVLAPTAISMYASLLRAAGAGTESFDFVSQSMYSGMIDGLYDMADEIDNFAAAVTAWQADNPDKVRLPD